MSHDRGCACGRERSEYDSCVEPNCFKRENKMDINDWHKAHGLAEPGTKAYGEKTVRTTKYYYVVKNSLENLGIFETFDEAVVYMEKNLGCPVETFRIQLMPKK